MKYIMTLLWLSFGFYTMAQQEPIISIKADTTNIKIGEQLTFYIQTSKANQVVFPVLQLDSLEVAKELPTDTLANGYLKKYKITGFDKGAYYIGSQEILIDAKSYFTDSLLVNVATVKVDTAKLAQYYTTKDFEEAPYTFSEVWYRSKNYMFISLGIIAFLLMLYFLFRNKKEEKKASKIIIPPYVTARQELKDLESKELWQNNKIKEYYSQLTDIVRKYLGGELNIQAIELTTEELMFLLQAENKTQALGLDKDLFLRLKKLLSQADFVKFAKQKPLDSEIKGHESDAKFVIETVHQIVENKNIEESNEEQ